MGDHHHLTGLPKTSLPPHYAYGQPGTSTNSVPHVYNPGQSGHNGLEDIPDIEAYERSLHRPAYNSQPIIHDFNQSPGDMSQKQSDSEKPLGFRNPKVEVIDDQTPMMSPVSHPTHPTKVLQRSGIKMEIPVYLDPDSHDEEPEEGVTYPDPDLFDVKNTNMTEYELEVMKIGKAAVEEARKKIEIPDASAPPNKIVEFLMFYRTLKESELLQLNAYRTKRNRLSLNLAKGNIDREFDQKACESLVKKLKDKKHDLQNLIDVVVSKGTKFTGCITIPRTLDGRLQVHGRKGFPHVVYGKLWRFSEMTKNETRHVDHCKHAFEMKSDMVCVNPYHYEVVIGTMIVGQRDSHDNREMTSSHATAQPRYQTPNLRPSMDSRHGFTSPSMQMPGMAPQPSMNGGQQHPTPNGYHQVHHPHAYPQPTPMHPHPQMPPTQMIYQPQPIRPEYHSPLSYPGYNHLVYGDYQNSFGGMDVYSFPNTYVPPMPQIPIHDHQLPIEEVQPQPLDDQKPPSPVQAEPTRQFSVSLSMFRQFCRQQFGEQFFDEDNDNDCEPAHSGHEFIETKKSPLLGVEIIRKRLTDGDTLEGEMPEDAPYHDLCDFLVKLTSETLVMTEEEPQSIEQMDKWGTIVYYENALEIGKKKCCRGEFHVDGGFIASEYRYSLGLEPNPVRTSAAYKVRRAIIDGIRFSYKDDGSVWLQNYMKLPIFVTSGYLDEQNGGMKVDKVHKMYGSAKLKVFGFKVVKNIIRDSLFSKHMALMFVRGVSTPMDQVYRQLDFEDLKEEASRPQDSLAKYCCVRISFCKGFGEGYPERPKITDCPCWIELKVNTAYDFMDRVLNDLGNRHAALNTEDFARLGINVSDD